MTDDRAQRALTDIVAVEEYAPGMARVVSWSDAYILDLRGEGCACPDKEYNDAPRCKHEHAARLATADAPTPFIVTDSLHEPTAAADGGERPQDCSCDGLDGELACFACFRAGFETAA